MQLDGGEFLRAMNAAQVAQEDLPEFPPEQDIAMDDLPNWIQELWPRWQQRAQLGPGAVEFLGRVETWYTDHQRVQHCLTSRIVTLGPDPTEWQADLLRAWGDFVLTNFDVTFVLVDPMTDDPAPNIVAQILLLQRPEPFSRSIIVTVYDSAIQRGMPRSCAIVTGDRVRLHSVLLMTNLLNQCPPEIIYNRCRLFFEERDIRGEDFVQAAHGFVFAPVIQRDVTIDLLELLALPDPLLRQRLAAVLERGTQELNTLEADRPPPLPPDWFNDLELAFDVHAAVELAEEGPTFYVHTWYLDARHSTSCQVPRPVRLRADRRTWRSEVLAVWQDQIQPHQHVHIYAASPAPPRLPWMAPTVHLLLCQHVDDDHTPVLITAVDPSVEPSMYFQCMHSLPRRVSVADVMLAHFPSGGVSGPCRVRRGTIIFPAFQPAPVGPGDSLEIDIMEASGLAAPHGASDTSSLLQKATVLHSAAARKTPVQISLDAVIPHYPTAQPDHGHPELLFSEQDDWVARLNSVQVKFAPLPIGLNVHAATLHALQDPHAYLEPALANCFALYVDGSARGAHAAWRVVAVSYDWQGLPTLHGVLADHVLVNTTDPGWIGAEFPDNISAELTASVAAHLTALLLPCTSMTVIRPDLQLSAKLSDATWSCTSHHELVQIAHWLGLWFHQGGGRCAEVRGHSSHPWNELADSLAKHVCAGRAASGALDFGMCHEALRHGDIRWAWFQLQHPAYRTCYPSPGVPTSWVVSPLLRRIDSPPLAPSCDTTRWNKVSFDMASANVLALGQDGDLLPDESASSRAERLDAQWHAQGFAVLGVQESRRPEGRYATSHYIIFASGAQLCGQVPHYGCELWLHKTLPFMRSDDSQLAFAEVKPAVSHADPRRLVVHLHAESVSCTFVVLHAPCRSQHNSLADIDQWWTRTSELLRLTELAPLTWVLVDANAPLASHACDHFCYAWGGTYQ